MMTLIWLAVGLVCLVVGAESLVRGASRLATMMGISPLVVGLTIVAFGTSAPELAVSIQSGLEGQAGIAVGNVVGSNIFNVLFILGISALIVPLVVSQQLVRLDVPLMIAVSVLVLILGWDGRISALEGSLLFAGIIAYTLFLFIQSRRESKAVQAEYEQEFGPASPALRAAGCATCSLSRRGWVCSFSDPACWLAVRSKLLTTSGSAISSSA